MKKFSGVLFVIVFVFICNGVVYGHDTADSFIFPLNNYTDDSCLDWGEYGVLDFAGKKHLADDRCVPEGTDVLAVARGKVKFTLDDSTGLNLFPRYWYGLIVIEHTLADDSRVCSIYGHVKPVVVDFNGVQRKLQVGDEIVKGQKIGEIVNYPQSSEHIHFGIYNGAYQTVEGVGGTLGTWLFGYTLPAGFPGNYLNPVDFVNSHMEIGNYSDGFHTNGTSQAFLDAYNRYNTDIGWPIDNNDGGVFVHEWQSSIDPGYSIWLQDFKNSAGEYFTLVLNEYDGENKVYILQGGFRDLYLNSDAPRIDF